MRTMLSLMFLLLSASLLMAETLPSFADLPDSAAPPDPLVMLDGTKVATAAQWTEHRRPELKKLVQHYMYGFAPAAPDNLRAEVVRVDPQAIDGLATLEEIKLTFGPEDRGVINLLLLMPNERMAAAPAFVGLNFGGNHSVLADPKIALPTVWMRDNKDTVVNNQATDQGRGKDVDVWSAKLLIRRGYALATAHYGDIDPDKPDSSDGIQSLYYQNNRTKPLDREWGSIAAWAWGLSRMVDYLATRNELDAQRLAVIGHSRLGKTALLAGALDERFAFVCPHQSGTGGMALSRNNDQETVKRINTAFPHWFNENFKQFNDQVTKIPFDQHSLVALCAPRPVFDTEGLQDKWANYDNAERSLQGADAVYKLLGKRGYHLGRPLEQDQQVTRDTFGELMQYRRDETHVLNQGYWNAILDFADLTARKLD